MEKLNIPDREIDNKKEKDDNPFKPSGAFIGAAWAALFIGVIAFCVGLWNAEMALSEKGYYFAVLMFGLFSVVSVQKSVRDRMEKIPVSDIYYGICWIGTIMSLTLLVIGLWNADLALSEKGFYGMSFALSLFSAIAVQKNVRDTQNLGKIELE